MDGHPWQTWLAHVHGPTDIDAPVLCLFLIHNEAHLLPDLFAHYRAMGDLHFLVIDDRSTDDTRAILTAQPDVTVFEPVEGSTYSRDKREWRGALLDAFADGRWCLVIDTDERLVWRGAPERTLMDLIGDLEAGNLQGLAATMVDMYADQPISEHVSADAPLSATFNCFDDPAKDPLAYRTVLSPSAFRKRFPTPNTIVIGGMRERLFGSGPAQHGPILRFLQGGTDPYPRQIQGRQLPWAEVLTRLTRPRGDLPPLNLTKVPLVRWSGGLRYNGGAHHLSAPLSMATECGVLLHYPFTRGADGIAYLAARGQHAASGSHYRSVLDANGAVDLSPAYFGTSVLEDYGQLEPFFGDIT